jgi:hypothetical protein
MTRDQRQGQALVEMALMLPVLLILILGTICAMQLLLTQLVVFQATRIAAHQAALIGGDDGPSGTVRSVAANVLNNGVGTRADRAIVTVTCSAQPCRRYSLITVRIDYHDAFWVPVEPFISLSLRAQVVRIVERDARS